LNVEKYNVLHDSVSNSIENQLLLAYTVTTYERVITCKKGGLIAGLVSDVIIECFISSPILIYLLKLYSISAEGL